jgi:hypothetical protein
MAKDSGWDLSRENRRKRLRLLRIKMKMNQQEFAAWVGIPYKKWNHYERGYEVPRDAAFILVQKFKGLTHEWIWYGRQEGFRFQNPKLLDQLNKLAEAEQKLAPAQPGEPEYARIIRDQPPKPSRPKRAKFMLEG